MEYENTSLWQLEYEGKTFYAFSEVLMEYENTIILILMALAALS